MFPKNESIRQEWIMAMGKENFVPHVNSFLCSQHFESDCFYYPVGGTKQRIYIKPGSIPTIFNIPHYSRKSKMPLKQSFTNINCIVEKNNAIVKFGNECLERDITESNVETYANDTIINNTKTYQIKTENTESNIKITSCVNTTMDTTMDNMIGYQMAVEDTSKEYPATPKRKLIRRGNPRYIGDCTLSDFQSPRKALRN
nr:PREDICTED: uncharacterized protein LOC105672190 [Linepithema humile]